MHPYNYVLCILFHVAYLVMMTYKYCGLCYMKLISCCDRCPQGRN